MEYFFKIASTCSIHKIDGCNNYYIIDQSNGCWCVLDKKYISFISTFIGKTIGLKDLLLSKDLLSLLKVLFYKGVLEINNKTYLKVICEGSTDKNLTIILNTTNKCNIRCKYCYAYSDDKIYADFQVPCTMDFITKLVTNNEENKVTIVFHGGEPLLCWDGIVEMVKSLNGKLKNISYSIQTNGILINQQIIDFIKSHKIKIGISLDGFNKQTNINRFGVEDKNDYLKKILDNIDSLIFNGVNVGVLSVITEDNYRDLLQSIIFLVNRGVKNFGFNFLLTKGRGINNKMKVPTGELVDIYVKIARYINDYNANHEKEDYISERTVSVLIYSLSHKTLGACFSTPCNAGESLLALDVNGDIYPCDEFVGDSEFCIGNARSSSFSMDDIKNDNMTKLIHRSCCMIEKCKQCPIDKLCPFKCPSDSYYRAGDLFHPHSMCNFTKLILPIYMHLLQNGIINSKYFIFN